MAGVCIGRIVIGSRSSRMNGKRQESNPRKDGMILTWEWILSDCQLLGFFIDWLGFWAFFGRRLVDAAVSPHPTSKGNQI